MEYIRVDGQAEVLDVRVGDPETPVPVVAVPPYVPGPLELGQVVAHGVGATPYAGAPGDLGVRRMTRLVPVGPDDGHDESRGAGHLLQEGPGDLPKFFFRFAWGRVGLGG